MFSANSPSIVFALIFSPLPPNHSIQRDKNIRFCVYFYSDSLVYVFSFFFASSYQAAVSADNTHWPNARCRRDDTEMDRVLHSVSRARFLFRFAFRARVASDLIVLNQLKTYNLCCYRHSTHSFSCSGRSDEEAPLVASPSSIPYYWPTNLSL